MSTERPGWDDYFAGIAQAVAARGDCTRRQVGAVIADENHRVISTGYNGTMPGNKGCLAGGCPRGKHYAAFIWGTSRNCACGADWPCHKAVPSGSSYDTGPGTCIALHAEQNALLYAFRAVAGMTLYITDEPCDGCLKLIRGARISRVVTPSSDISWGLSLSS